MTALALLAIGTGCTADPPEPAMTTVADVGVGDISVHIALDAAGRVCSSVGDSPPVCQGSSGAPGVGIQDARLDPEAAAPLLLRVLVDPATELPDPPAQAVRVGIDAKRDLLLAVSTLAEVCFSYTLPDGTPGTVWVHQTEVDSGSGATSAVLPDNGCGS